MTVQELEKAIAKLSPDELAELRAWFLERDQDEWDCQIARDSEAGKPGKPIQQAKCDYAEGNGRELRGISRRRSSGSATMRFRRRGSGRRTIAKGGSQAAVRRARTAAMRSSAETLRGVPSRPFSISAARSSRFSSGESCSKAAKSRGGGAAKEEMLCRLLVSMVDRYIETAPKKRGSEPAGAARLRQRPG